MIIILRHFPNFYFFGFHYRDFVWGRTLRFLLFYYFIIYSILLSKVKTVQILLFEDLFQHLLFATSLELLRKYLLKHTNEPRKSELIAFSEFSHCDKNKSLHFLEWLTERENRWNYNSHYSGNSWKSHLRLFWRKFEYLQK